MTCDHDLGAIDLKQMFGDSVLNIDRSCGTVSTAIFSFQVDDKKNNNRAEGCGAVEMRMNRIGRDCCGTQTPAIEHTLQVERLPPSFTTEAGSLDKMLLCDANIHPTVTGVPAFSRGCADAVQTLEASDVVTFNADSCDKTITRTFTLRDDDCATTEQTYVQNITLEDHYLPQFDIFPDDISVRVFDSYGTDATGFPTASAHEAQ